MSDLSEPCAICLDTFVTRDSGRRTLECGHMYHESCILEPDAAAVCAHTCCARPPPSPATPPEEATCHGAVDHWDVDWASPCGKTAELVAFARGAAAFVVQLREGPGGVLEGLW